MVNSHAIPRGASDEWRAFAQTRQRPPSPATDKLLNGDDAIVALDIGQISNDVHLIIVNAAQNLTDFVVKDPRLR